MVLATTENTERLGKKASLSLPKGRRKRGKCHKFILKIKVPDMDSSKNLRYAIKGFYDYVRTAFFVFGILHDVTLKDHSLKSLSFQLEVFVILITNYISFVADFLYHSL